MSKQSDLDRLVEASMEIEKRDRLIAELLVTLRDAYQQIEYLHDKFGETGSGNSVLARIDRAIAKAEGES